MVYAVEFSHRSGRDLINMAKKRMNVVPIIEDARHPHKYRMLVSSGSVWILPLKIKCYHISIYFIRDMGYHEQLCSSRKTRHPNSMPCLAIVEEEQFLEVSKMQIPSQNGTSGTPTSNIGLLLIKLKAMNTWTEPLLLPCTVVTSMTFYMTSNLNCNQNWFLAAGPHGWHHLRGRGAARPGQDRRHQRLLLPQERRAFRHLNQGGLDNPRMVTWWYWVHWFFSSEILVLVIFHFGCDRGRLPIKTNIPATIHIWKTVS